MLGTNGAMARAQVREEVKPQMKFEATLPVVSGYKHVIVDVIESMKTLARSYLPIDYMCSEKWDYARDRISVQFCCGHKVDLFETLKVHGKATILRKGQLLKVRVEIKGIKA